MIKSRSDLGEDRSEDPDQSRPDHGEDHEKYNTEDPDQSRSDHGEDHAEDPDQSRSFLGLDSMLPEGCE